MDSFVFCTYKTLAQYHPLRLTWWNRTVTAKLGLYLRVIVNPSKVYDIMRVGTGLLKL